MAAIGYSITGITDIALSGTVQNVIANKRGVTLARPSTVQIYLTRETANVTASVTVGGVTVLESGPVNINATTGTLPSTQDDLVIECIAAAGDEIIISGANADGAAARELRALVKVMPLQ